MNQDEERSELRCPHCQHVVATAPKDNLPEGELVCPACGALLQAPGLVDKLINKVEKITKKAMDSPDKSG